MASNGNAGADSWPGFLSELTKSFLILRDIFGYALPGAVFLSIGVLSRRFSLHDVQYFLEPYHLPAWLAAVLGVGACYVTGHLMAQIAYFFFNTWKIPFFGKKSAAAKAGVPPAEPEQCAHTQIPVDLITLRGSHPELLVEYERQSIMTQLRGGTGAAMLVGSLVFYFFPTPPFGWMVGGAGTFLSIVFWFSAIPHMDDLKNRTAAAGTQANAADKAAKTLDTASAKKVLEDFISAATDAMGKS